MHRDHQHQAEFRSGRSDARKEWGRSSDESRQVEVPEHERLAPKARRSDAIRDGEALRQIRELRGRY